MSSYTPSLVANAFLYKARQSGAQMSHMKLQKLVFFMHAWSLAALGKSFVAETPEAWPYGPVFGTLYHELKTYGSRNIDSYLLQINARTGHLEAQIPVLKDQAFWGLVDQVWDRYGSLSALQLSALTHEPGGPWEKARLGHVPLSNEIIRDHYRVQLQRAK